MYREIAKLILYGDLDRECILYQLGEIFRRFEEKSSTKPALIKDIYTAQAAFDRRYGLWI